METQQYQYRPLLGPDAIRIIIVHPEALISSPLSCSVIHSTLTHYDDSLIEQYTALSYVWGDSNNRRTILVDEKALSITASLEIALRHMRDTQKDMMVWADGICINQSDVEEKSKQVRMMGKIYEIAMHTIIFLGQTTPESEKIFELLNSELSRQAKLAQEFKLDIADIEKPCQDIARLVTNMEWFKRIWVLQELVLSRDPWAQVGIHRLRWGDFRSVIDCGVYSDIEPKKNCLGYKYVSEMGDIRRGFKKGFLLTPTSYHDFTLSVLHLRRGHGVLDPRDMIYGHLAMFERQYFEGELEEGRFEIDYHKPLSEVYSNFALYLLNRLGRFSFCRM